MPRPVGYELRAFSLPADLEDLFTAELWSLGALGFQVGDAEAGRLRLDAYFPSPVPAALARHDFDPWRRRGVAELTTEELADRDWLAPYRAACEPFDVASSFRVDPRDPVDGASGSAPSSRRTLRIPARTAFGTGSHPSTSLALEWLEELDIAGLAVLDVGTGSGILSFAAEILGAGPVVGLDVDAQAACIAHGNALLNEMTPRFFAGSVAALAARPRFDLALVNVLPENVLHEIPRLIQVLKPAARLVSSGNLASRREELLARWTGWGFELAGEKRDGEWAAWLLALAGRQ